MATWTLTITGNRVHTIIGSSADRRDARATALRAVATLNAAATADRFDAPTYEVRIDGELAAILGTGVTAEGLPDHREVADLLAHITDADPLT